MRIVDRLLTPGSNLYSVVCYCGFPFKTTADNRGKVKCPHCKREGDLREMIKAWKATPEENLQRLKELSVKARALFNQYNALSALERVSDEGKAMETKLDEYYKEAKGIISTAVAAG